jgi:hypothetical protein
MQPALPTTDPLILRTVPHRPPILRIHTMLTTTTDSATTAGHEPSGPGALPWAAGAIEGLAQTAAVLLGHLAGEPAPGAEPPRGMLVSVKRFTVDRDPKPLAPIHYHVKLVRRLGPNALVAGHAEQQGQRLCAGELTLWTNLGNG